MGPPEDGQGPARSQSDSHPVRGHPRTRRCLLKGCETPFRPRTAMERYCSEACREEAREWSAWRADQTYRASERGRARRQEQSKRYRERVRRRSGSHARTSGETSEGDRRQEIPGSPCDRPGCYDLFCPTRRSPLQRFCSRSCRRAWKRVLQRERRWTGHGQSHSSPPPVMRLDAQRDARPCAPRCSSHIAPTKPSP